MKLAALRRDPASPSSGYAALRHGALALADAQDGLDLNGWATRWVNSIATQERDLDWLGEYAIYRSQRAVPQHVEAGAEHGSARGDRAFDRFDIGAQYCLLIDIGRVGQPLLQVGEARL